MNNSKSFIDDLNGTLAKVFMGNSGDFILDDNGLLAMSFDSGVEVTLQAVEGSRQVIVSSEVVRVAGADSVVLKRALELNHFGISPLGAYLALDEAQSSIVLCQVGEATLLDVELLGDFLAGFATGVVKARELINAAGTASRADNYSDINDVGAMRV